MSRIIDRLNMTLAVDYVHKANRQRKTPVSKCDDKVPLALPIISLYIFRWMNGVKILFLKTVKHCWEAVHHFS